MSASVLVVAGEQLARYGFGDSHPFGPDRHAAFYREFESRGLPARVRVVAPQTATVEELLTFHTVEHVARVREQSQTGQGFLDAGDTPAFRGVYEAAACVVGSTLRACEAVMSGEARHAFIPIAGLHHAGRNHAAGFCVFNDCGVAVEVLRARHGLQRIAYVDIDAHHGDGMYYAFESDPHLIFADVHEDGGTLYPGTGAATEVGRGVAAGTKLNLPLPAGAADAQFDEIWPQIIAHLEPFEPQFILMQCGADSLAGDPITHMQLSARSHARAARELVALAERLGHGRVVATGGGGYNRQNLAQAWNGVVEAMLDA